jgi:2-keto-4-pentenoate hydratase/2-oxohepta-3-ene-1,7-dioic acid hydratase in catechol pathway
MTWSLATYQRGETIGVAALRADGALVAPPDLKRWNVHARAAGGLGQAEDILRAIEIDDAPVIDYDTILAPIRWPRKVICAGVNYRRHIREMGGESPRRGLEAVLLPQAAHHHRDRALPTPSSSMLRRDSPLRLGSRTRRRHRRRRP